MRDLIYIPRNPDLDRVLTALPGELQRYGEHARLLLHFISVRKWLGLLDARYARLHSSILCEYIPNRKLAPLKRFLIGQGVLETDNYSAGCKSTGYRVALGFDGSPMPVQLTDPTLIRKLRKWRESYGRDEKSPGLQAVIDQRRAVLDSMRATLAVLTLTQPAETLAHKLHVQGEDFDHVSYVCLVIELRNHGPVIVDDFGFRVHSIITCAAAAIRPYLRINGKPLIELDVANAQPLIFAALLRCPDICTTYMVNAQHNGRARCPGAGVGSLIRGIPSGEVDEFVRLCEEGLFYEHLMDRGSFPNRQRAKELLYRDVFFGKPDITGLMTETFEACWPSIIRVIRELKSRFDYKIIARLLQRGESHIMIDGTCQRLTCEYPGIAYLTIHDAVLVGQEHGQTVQRLIVDEFARYGVRATVRRKVLKKTSKNYLPQGK